VPERQRLSDLELIDQVKKKNQSAFLEIVKRYEPKVAATVFGMLGNCLEADDVGQEVFIRFYKSMYKFRGEANLGTYLTRIAINLSLNEIKRRKRRTFVTLEDLSQNQNRGKNGYVNNNANFEKKEIIQQAIQKIDVKYRIVIMLRLIQGYSTAETSKILKLPQGTVLSRLSRGQLKLKKLLTPYLDEL
jgi:RNA polymerase sigma-70 factor (ECF subfamily)